MKDSNHPTPHIMERASVACMIEAVEDLLDAKGITIPNDEKDENENASNIYGTDYAFLEERFAQILGRENIKVDGLTTYDEYDEIDRD